MKSGEVHQALKGFEHSSYDDGKAWIEKNGGELVSSRRGVSGSNIETYRIPVEGGHVLATFDPSHRVKPQSGVELPPEWRLVNDIKR